MKPGFYCMDCMEALPLFPDGFFDLAIVDPPYGGGYVESSEDGKKIRGGDRLEKPAARTLRRIIRPVPHRRSRCCAEAERTGRTGSGDAGARGSTATGSRRRRKDLRGGGMNPSISANRTGGTWAAKYGRQGGVFDDAKAWHSKPSDLTDAGAQQGDLKSPVGISTSITHWDVAPPPEYFDELARVSKNQIIWGGNYFDLPPTRCFVVWDKRMPEDFTMAMAEYAWTSFNDNAKVYYHAPQGNAKEKRFHPTQKPVALYTWLLGRYAKPGMRILDTHVGSASSLIACRRAGLEYWGFEIDPEYYRMASERLERETAQVNLFDLDSSGFSGEK